MFRRGWAAVVVKAKGVTVYLAETGKAFESVYPEGGVESLEVRDKAKMKNWWGAVVKKLGLKGKQVTVVMDDSACFQKFIGSDSEAESFWGELPIKAELLIKMVVHLPDKLLAVAVNRELFEYIQTADGPKIKMAVSDGWLFGGGPAVWNWEVVNKLRRVKNYSQGNLLGKDVNSGDRPKYFLWLATGGGAVLIVIFAVIGWWWMGRNKNTKVLVPEVVVAEQVAPTDTPEPTHGISKEQIRIEVLNGSGEAGLAGRMKEILDESGYTQVRTGNSQTTEESTIIKYLPGFEAAATDVWQLVSQYYETASPEADTEIGQADIQVLLGGD